MFINPSTSDVVATTTAEALAMGKWAVVPDIACNAFFKQFRNCLTYKDSAGFIAAVDRALQKEPAPLSDCELRCVGLFSGGGGACAQTAWGGGLVHIQRGVLVRLDWLSFEGKGGAPAVQGLLEYKDAAVFIAAVDRALQKEPATQLLRAQVCVGA